jgi:hypothetical protein
LVLVTTQFWFPLKNYFFIQKLKKEGEKRLKNKKYRKTNDLVGKSRQKRDIHA